MKNQLWTGLTALLGTFCLVLLALAALTALLLRGATEPDPVSTSEQTLAAELDNLKTVSFNDRSGDDYSAAILQRPLFFADRSLPEVVDEQEAARLAAQAEQQAEEESAPLELDARLAGIIITPDKRIAMIADNKSKKTLVLREGMALEGEQAAWQIAQISERTVSFAAGEQSAELELQVNTKGLPAPAAARTSSAARAETNNTQRANQQQNAQQNTNNASDAASRREQTAAEIRRRIAERRAQLRAERARQAQDGNDNG